MKSIGTAFFVLAVVLAFSAVQADEMSMEAFYADCIMKKSDQREQLAGKLESSNSIDLLDYGKTAADQARFYTTNKNNLVLLMLEQKVERNPHAVEYFLIRAYFDQMTQTPLQTASESE